MVKHHHLKQLAGNLAKARQPPNEEQQGNKLMIYGGKWQKIACKNELTCPEIPSFPVWAMMVAVLQNFVCRNSMIPREIQGI